MDIMDMLARSLRARLLPPGVCKISGVPLMIYKAFSSLDIAAL